MHSERNHKQNKKTAYEMGENTCKWCYGQGIDFQNIQTAHTGQYQKSKQLNQKWVEDLNRHFVKEDIQMAKKKHIANYKRNVNQTYSEVSHQSEWPSSKSLQTVNLGESVEKREPS